jgi:hypothetical protein
VTGKPKQQKRNSRIMGFHEFVKRRSLTEVAAIDTEIAAAAFITIDGTQSAQDKQSAIDGFAASLKNLSGDGRQVIAMAVSFD